MSVVYRRLGPADTELVRNAAEGVFDRLPAQQWTAEFLSDPRHHLVAAIKDGQLIGFASVVHYLHPDKAPELWINEVGVAPHHRNCGIGRQIMAALLAWGRELGCKNAWVLTEPSNEAARRLYTTSGASECAPTVMYEFRLEN